MLLNTVKKSIKGPIKIFFGQSKTCEVLNKLKSRGFRASSLTTYDFSSFCATSYGVYISQLIRIARMSSHVPDCNARNKIYLVNFSIRAICIINSERLFLNFIADTMNWCQNLR